MAVRSTSEAVCASSRRRGWRSRWAAVGAAVAVSFGAGGFYIGNAADDSSSSSFVAVTPVRVLDTRNNLGLTGVFTSPTSRDLLVTGSIPTADGTQVVVPAGATAVSMNVTVVGPTVGGFLSVRPSDASGAPTTSSLNFAAGQVIPNAVTVQVPTVGGDAGKIEITYNASNIPGPTTHVLVDIVGYYQATAAGPLDGTPCTANGLPGTIISGSNGDGDVTTKCFRKLVTTFAGTGTAGTTDGALAQFENPRGVAVDAAGNVYVADTLNNRIRKITPAGIVTTLAGQTTPGDDDGVGTSAKFRTPEGIALDAVGNVYVADTGGHRIRKITPVGVVTTLAGTGVEGYQDGAGAIAKFAAPRGVAVDADGNVYVADTINNRIRKVTPDGTVSTFAGSSLGGADGTGTDALFGWPTGLAIDPLGNLYVADSLNNNIRKITPGAVVTTFAGSGMAGHFDFFGTQAWFDSPTGVAIDAVGNLYVADRDNNAIRKITIGPGTTMFLGFEFTGDDLVSTLAGSTLGYSEGVGTAALFDTPLAVAVDTAGNVYVADADNNRIRKIS